MVVEGLTGKSISGALIVGCLYIIQKRKEG